MASLRTSDKMENSLLVAISVIMVLFLGECSLRMSGRIPGEFRTLSGFHSVDSLVELKNFVTDDFGIYKFGPWVSDSVQRHFEEFGCGLQSTWQRTRIKQLDVLTDDIDRVYRGFIELKEGKPCFPFFWTLSETSSNMISEFRDAFHLVRTRGAVTDWDWSILEMVDRPYNSQGFRGIPFSSDHSGSPRVLVIGDSFVYGMSARPYYNSFTDLLIARGYLVYSAGIPGTDPGQYAAIAAKYIPKLRPDAVIVCFFPGNDLMPFPREPHLSRPHEHMTNAGLFDSSPEGEYLDALCAYDYYLSLITIPQESKLAKAWSSTVITSLIWGALYSKGMANSRAITAYETGQNVSIEDRIRFTRPYLKRIDSICKEHRITLLNTVIPDASPRNLTNDNFVTFDTIVMNKMFSEQHYYLPFNNFHAEIDFPENDYHFNNVGSKKYADFLDTLLRRHGFVPTDKVTFDH